MPFSGCCNRRLFPGALPRRTLNAHLNQREEQTFMIADVLTDMVEKKMAERAEKRTHDYVGGKSLAKGLLAGLIGGIIATAAKTLAERVYPPRTHGEPVPTDVVTDRLSATNLTPDQKQIASEAIHWGFGALTGAAYGALAEFYPAAAGKDGAKFGMTLMALTHEGVLPAMGLSAEPVNQTTREKTSEMTTHVIFGLVTETVRRYVRRML
jgi:putative membrane protein